MAQEDDEEDITFNVEEVQKIIRDNIELCLGGNIYSHSRTPQWITVITEKTLARLNKLNKPFKYISTTIVTAGLAVTCAVFPRALFTKPGWKSSSFIPTSSWDPMCQHRQGRGRMRKRTRDPDQRENDRDSEEWLWIAHCGCIFLGHCN